MFINEQKLMGSESRPIDSCKCPSCGEWYDREYMIEYEVQSNDGSTVLLCKHCDATHTFKHEGVTYYSCECNKYIREDEVIWTDLDGGRMTDKGEPCCKECAPIDESGI